MSYVLGASLGRGATSEVFAVAGDDQLAIKRLHPHLLGDASAVARFAAELERTRQISHPNVARVHAIGDGFLVLERIHGETLATRLARGPLTDDEVRELGAQIADGMAAVHARGVIHCDLKAANVMIAGTTPKIVDFGIARSLACDALATSTRVGTPAYMAPERWTAGLVTPAGDVWALGAILFEAATGRLPFDGFANGRCPQLVEPAPPARCSPVLARAIAACLDRDPARRPSMISLADLLRSDERMTQDVQAEPQPAPAVNHRRRWPVVAAAASVALAAAYALVPAPAATTALPLPVLTTLASPSPSPAVAAPQPAESRSTPARAITPPARHSRARAPVRPAGETLD
jgi:eukaryotic-like serine/threonine-protein kinase